MDRKLVHTFDHNNSYSCTKLKINQPDEFFSCKRIDLLCSSILPSTNYNRLHSVNRELDPKRIDRLVSRRMYL